MPITCLREERTLHFCDLPTLAHSVPALCASKLESSIVRGDRPRTIEKMSRLHDLLLAAEAASRDRITKLTKQTDRRFQRRLAALRQEAIREDGVDEDINSAIGEANASDSEGSISAEDDGQGQLSNGNPSRSLQRNLDDDSDSDSEDGLMFVDDADGGDVSETRQSGNLPPAHLPHGAKNPTMNASDRRQSLQSDVQHQRIRFGHSQWKQRWWSQIGKPFNSPLASTAVCVDLPVVLQQEMELSDVYHDFRASHSSPGNRFKLDRNALALSTISDA